MPYFSRKPLEDLLQFAGSGVDMARLPSRGQGLGHGLLSEVLRHDGEQESRPDAADFDARQVHIADAILADERSRALMRPAGRPLDTPDTGDLTTDDSSERPAEPRHIETVSPEPLLRPVPRLLAQSSESQNPRMPEIVADVAPILCGDHPVRGGEVTTIGVPVENEDETTVNVAFHCTGLVGADGRRIEPHNVSYQPEEQSLAPGESSSITVRIDVPPGTTGGTYSGLIRASQFDDLHAVLVIEVIDN